MRKFLNRLILATLLVVVSMMAVAPAVVAQTLVDSVDVGTPSTEAGHNLTGWGPIEPDTHGGYWGDLANGGYPDYTSSDNRCRVTWYDNEGDGDPNDPGSDPRWATLTLNTGAGMTAARLKVRILDGHANDSFQLQVVVNGNSVYSYGDQYSTETWITHDIDISSLNATGIITMRIEATGPSWSGWATFGQLGVDWVELYADPTPAPTPTTPGGEGSNCFIASASYGADDSSVETLRNFRDSYMVTNPIGAGLVSTYYRISPPIAEFVDGHAALKPIVRVALLPAVAMGTAAVSITLAQKIAVVGTLVLILLASVLWLRKRTVKL